MKPAKKLKLKRVIRKLKELRKHHKKLAYAKPNIRISSNKDRCVTMAVNMGLATAYDIAIKHLKEVQ